MINSLNDSNLNNIKKELKINKSEYSILKVTANAKTPELNPNKDYFKSLVESFQMIGLNNEEIRLVFRILVAILLLGEQTFDENIKNIEDLLGTSLKILSNQENLQKILMVWLYKKLVNYVILKINEAFLRNN